MKSEEHDIVEPTPRKQSSLFERLTNVFVSPGEVFSELRGVPADSMNWAVPMVAMIVMGILFSVAVFSQESVVQGMREASIAEIDIMVEEGEMTQTQADKAAVWVEKIMSSKLVMLLGIVGSVFGTPIIWLIIAFLFHWIVRIASQSRIPFSKCFEVVGLSNVISTLGMIVTMPVVVLTGNIKMKLRLALVFQEFDPTEHLHALAAEVDIFRLWYIAVLAIAWSQLTLQPLSKCCAWLFGLWFAFCLGSIFLSL
ncbi:MAG: hypothetical protein M2R45_03710 [Verrucomicrobia subdivision 3 bacterium]|nr:hypothetical protein [Limisphaerales bacterium]MCS1414992.1 hypothetical protein [Limisphaerales bacterium]